jgi:hypothetical protein
MSSAPNIPAELVNPGFEPTVALPIVELVTQSILDALAEVTIGNGYQQNLQVGRVWKGGNPPDDLVCIVCELDDETDEQAAPELAAAYIQPYAIVILAFESEASTYPIRRRLQIAAADIHKALMGDYQRNGLAVDTKPGRHSWIDNAAAYGAMDGMVFEWRVEYRFNLNDPYQAR